ncbi:RCC2 [Symbiodinium pilosum]|uniref:RCC2 protein n=1 Tax=Symbiodinium pilosum TaxID=2952 RepID=A0A812WJT5_SYMPI|nr:RCC2 [Symbiodinium pilosum]
MTLRSLPAAPPDNHAFVVQVAVGKAHSVLLTDEGVLYSWGTNNEFGQLGRACHNQDKMLKPAPIIGGIKQEIVIQIACGMNHCVALTQRGALFAWGNNKAGQLGVDGFSAETPTSELAITAPTPVKHFEGQEISLCARSCSCGPESSACVTVRGEVYVWGAISYYMLGAQKKYGKGENCTVPVCIKNLPKELYAHDSGPEQVSVYKDHCPAIGR